MKNRYMIQLFYAAEFQKSSVVEADSLSWQHSKVENILINHHIKCIAMFFNLFPHLSPQWWHVQHPHPYPMVSWRAQSWSGVPVWATTACLATSCLFLLCSPVQEMAHGTETFLSACVSHFSIIIMIIIEVLRGSLLFRIKWPWWHFCHHLPFVCAVG